MKANELMIGDWVEDKYKPVPHKVDSWADFNSSEDLSPIFITPEILEKNGFEAFGEITRYRLLTETTSLIIEPMRIKSRLGTNWFWLTINTQDFEVVRPTGLYPFNYVHELQHALRLCGLNELADNFQV